MLDLDFFCSPIGLGHATRDIAIAMNLDLTVKFVTGSGAAKIIKDSEMIVEDVYRPPDFIVENGAMKSPAKWLWRYYQYYKDCKNISKRIIGEDHPNLVVSDEDFASLVSAQEKKIPTVLVTDILETRFTKGFGSIIEKKMNKSMNKIIQKCQVTIIPETGDDDGNIRRVGPIVRQTKQSREQLRKKFLFEKNTVVISVGGTDAGLFLIEKTLDAVSKVKYDIDVVLVSGPSLTKKFPDHIRNFGFVNNLHEIIYAADVLVSLAGKSTIDEAKAYGTPGIFIPIKGHFEQEDNARDEGFSFEDVFRLEKLIEEKLQQKRDIKLTDGALNAARIIKELLI